MDAARAVRYGVCAAVFAWVSATPPTASADPASNLAAAVDTALAHCPARQTDPLVERAAQLALHETDDYITHRSAYVPFTDPVQALKAIGYKCDKAVLFSGYGAAQADAIEGLMMEGAGRFSDCDYKRFGSAALYNSDHDYYLTSLVLAS